MKELIYCVVGLWLFTHALDVITGQPAKRAAQMAALNAAADAYTADVTRKLNALPYPERRALQIVNDIEAYSD